MATKPETRLQAALADYAVMRNALVIRINGGAMRTTDGRWFRASRWTAPRHAWTDGGVSDLVVIWRGRVLAVEVKIGKNTLSDNQGEFLEAAEAAGAVPVVAYSLDDLAAAMTSLLS